MSAKKEDKIIIKQFRDSSSHFWCNFSHYYLDKDNNILWASGESDNTEYRTALEAYIRRNKKTFKERQQSILDTEEKVYMNLYFGKYAGRNLSEIVSLDRKYLLWTLKNVDFGGKEKLKQEIIEILK